MSKFVFLFGAGASAGTNNVLPCTPPLMRELYDRLALDLPDLWGSTSPMAKHKDEFRNDFEGTFARVVLGTGPSGNPRDSLSLLEKQWPLALYFSKFILDTGAEDLYSELILRLRERGLIAQSIFGSLNYDCLLEQAALNLGLQVDYWSSRVDATTVQVAKLHGSCNFVTVIDHHGRAILASPGLLYEAQLIPIYPEVELEERLRERESASDPWYYPVMSQVSPLKENLLAPAQLQEIRNTWVEAMSIATRVTIVGVSPRESDSHVWKPIQETPATVSYIGGRYDFDKLPAKDKLFLAETFEQGLEPLVETLG